MTASERNPREIVAATDGSPKEVYGALTEGLHLAGYASQRAGHNLEWLLEDDRWKEIADTFPEFLEKVRVVTEQTLIDRGTRKRLARRIKEVEASTTQRQIGEALGVSHVTVGKDLGKQLPRPPEKPHETVHRKPDSGKKLPESPAKPADVTAVTPTTAKPKSAKPKPDTPATEGAATAQTAVRDKQRKKVREQRKEKQKTKAKAATDRNEKLAKPDREYAVAVIDPPWPMQRIERRGNPDNDKGEGLQVGFEYPTMTLAEIEALEVPAHKDGCHVFLWTTQKFLPAAFRILEGWNARYVLTFVWHKPDGMQPFDLPKYNAEFCLYARIGKPAPFRDLKDFWSCFNAPRGAHSEKPRSFYSMVRRVTHGPRIDMFARKAHPGFDRWGNEA